jgi:hypothetical protein
LFLIDIEVVSINIKGAKLKNWLLQKYASAAHPTGVD